MPRKTKICAACGAQTQAASMRPRPDAAENAEVEAEVADALGLLQ